MGNSEGQRRPRCEVQSLPMSSPMRPPLNKMLTQRLPEKVGTMRRECRLQCSTLGAGLSVSLTKWALGVTRPHRSDAAGRPGASSSVAARFARVSVVGRVVLGEAVLRPAVLGPFTQDGDKAPSVSLTTWAFSASAIEKCTAVTTAGITWSALLSRSHPGGAEGE